MITGYMFFFSCPKSNFPLIIAVPSLSIFLFSGGNIPPHGFSTHNVNRVDPYLHNCSDRVPLFIRCIILDARSVQECAVGKGKPKGM